MRPSSASSQEVNFFIELLGFSILSTIPSISCSKKFICWQDNLCKVALARQLPHLLWQYASNLPSDFDTTCLAGYLLRRNNMLSADTAYGILVKLSQHRHQGLYLTWYGIAPQQNEIDAVVNYNIQLFLKSLGYKESAPETHAPLLYYTEEFFCALKGAGDARTSPMRIYRDKNKYIVSPFITKALIIRNQIQKHLSIKMHRRAYQRELNTIYSELNKSHLLTKDLLALERGHHIIRGLVFLFLRNKGGTFHEITLKNLCQSTCTLWLLYTDLNKIFDKRLNIDQIPIMEKLKGNEHKIILPLNQHSTKYLRERAATIFSVTKKAFYEDNDLRRKKARRTIILSYQKSLGQVCPYYLFCRNAQEGKVLELFFHQYIFIKQMADDVHDLKEDLLAKKDTLPTSIYRHIRRRYSHEKSTWITIQVVVRQMKLAAQRSIHAHSKLPSNVRLPFWKKEVLRIMKKSEESKRDYLFGKGLLKRLKKTSGSIEI